MTSTQTFTFLKALRKGMSERQAAQSAKIHIRDVLNQRLRSPTFQKAIEEIRAERANLLVAQIDH